MHIFTRFCAATSSARLARSTAAPPPASAAVNLRGNLAGILAADGAAAARDALNSPSNPLSGSRGPLPLCSLSFCFCAGSDSRCPSAVRGAPTRMAPPTRRVGDADAGRGFPVCVCVCVVCVRVCACVRARESSEHAHEKKQNLGTKRLRGAHPLTAFFLFLIVPTRAAPNREGPAPAPAPEISRHHTQVCQPYGALHMHTQSASCNT